MSRGERLMMAVVVILTGCSGGGSVTATTPSTTATSSPATTTTVGVDPGSTTTTGTAGDRLAEIETIFQDLEQRRLTALYEGDRQAFAALFANEEYLARDLESFGRIEFDGPPLVSVVVIEVLADEPDCIAGRIQTTSGEDSAPGSVTVVLQPTPMQGWGFAYVGEGWLCDGPHPLAP